MAETSKEQRVYSKVFKSEAVALAEKREKPVSRIAKDLGINENMLCRWIQQTREAPVVGLSPFPGHGRLRDAELTRLQKENKALRGGRGEATLSSKS
jgi:transposase